MKIAYGYTIEPRGNDPLVDLADKALSQFSLASQPGIWLVDVIPLRMLLLISVICSLSVVQSLLNTLSCPRSSKTYARLDAWDRLQTYSGRMASVSDGVGRKIVRLC